MLPLSTFVLLTAAGTVAAAPFQGRVLEREEQRAAAYDYVVIGGGTAGLTVANRLSEDPDVRVLVLEAGIPDRKEGIAILQRYLGGTMQTVYDWNVTTAPQQFLGTANAVQNLTLGKVLGGSSVMNGMMFDRPAPEDINAWEELGNRGWNWAGLLPYYKKSETFTPPSPEQAAQFGITWDPSVHGDSGYIQSSYPNYIYPQNKNFQDAMRSLGIAQSRDQAGSALGAFWSPNTIDPHNQTRSSARSGYFDDFAGRANLHALTSRHVTRLLTAPAAGKGKGVRITGVEYVEYGQEQTKRVVHARCEYILSAGSVHSPQLLQLSGIGPKKLLDEFEIPVAVDLPGVGENFQDHPVISMIFNLSKVFPSPHDVEINATFDAEQKALFYANRTGTWTAGSPNSVAFLPLTNYTDRASALVAAYAAHSPTAHLRTGLEATVVAGYTKQRQVLLKHLRTAKMAAMEFIWLSGLSRLFQMPFSFAIQHPLSRGFVAINGTSAFAQPVVDLRTLSNPVDAELYLDAIKFGRRVVATPAIQTLGPHEVQPGAQIVADDDLREYTRGTASTMFHPAGTCAMMPRRLGGVVDARLRVHGVDNLRVVDASIMPIIVASHLQSTVYAIAEKAADMLKEDR